MTKDDVIRMAREAGWPEWDIVGCEIELERFAALVAAAEREKVAQWMMKRGYATGHGDTLEDLLQELDWQIADGWNRALMNGVKTEREACAKVADEFDPEMKMSNYGQVIANRIRARGQE
jgi:hypothetical protein